MKNPFKRKKAKFPTPSTPRPFSEIQAEYVDLRAKAGEVQYQLYINTKTLAQLNAQLENLNYEASERQRLDKETAKAAPKPETTPQTEAQT